MGKKRAAQRPTRALLTVRRSRVQTSSIVRHVGHARGVAARDGACETEALMGEAAEEGSWCGLRGSPGRNHSRAPFGLTLM